MPYDPTNEEAALERGYTREQLRELQDALGVSNRTLSTFSDSQRRRVLLKLEYPDRARDRERLRRRQENDDAGAIPVDAMPRALAQLDALRSRATRRERVAGIPTGPDVEPGSLRPGPLPRGAGIPDDRTGWTALGPGNIGGRTRSIIVHRDDPDRIWVGSVGGGVWFTATGGLSWDPVNDLMASLAVSCMVVHPNEPLTMYAGTGEGFSNVDAIRGAGIFFTKDGTNWHVLSSTVQEHFQYVNRLAISADGNTLLAATATGLFRSLDPQHLLWTAVLPGPRMGDVRFHPQDPARAVASALRDGRAWFTTDGGQTWQEAVPNPPWSRRIELTYSMANPDVVYASADTGGGQIWRSDDGGQSYTRRSSENGNGFPANFLGGQGWYDNTIWAGDPGDENLLVVGGVDLWRSFDGGDTFERISKWSNSASAHADHHCIVSHPGYDGVNNRIVFFGNDGGVYRADDVTTVGSDQEHEQGWNNLVQGYAVTQFYGGSGHAGSGTIVGGAQDNGSLSLQSQAGANGWGEFFGGDGGYVASDPGDPLFHYGEYVYLGIFRNDNGATSDASWWAQYISGRFWNDNIGNWDWKPSPFHIPDARFQRALFIAPFVMDPNDANRLLGGGASLWVTNDAKEPNTDASGPSWSSIKPSEGNDNVISAIATAQGNSDIVWVGHEQGDVFVSTDATSASPSWQSIPNAGLGALTARRFCTRILVDPQDTDTVFATFGGYVRGNVWRTMDAGQTWQNVGMGLPEAPVRGLAIHPDRSDFVYVGTEVGLFTSEDGGTSWSPTNEGPTNCAIYDMFWLGKQLVVVTHGRGMFQIGLSNV